MSGKDIDFKESMARRRKAGLGLSEDYDPQTEQPSKRGRPAGPARNRRSYTMKMDATLHDEAMRVAQLKSETLSAAIEGMLRTYVEENRDLLEHYGRMMENRG